MKKTVIKNYMIAMMVIALSACGFKPLYSGSLSSQAQSVQSSFNQTEIAIIPNYEGQFLRNLLLDQLYQSGDPASPKYRLSAETISIEQTDLDLTKNADSTRAQLRVRTRIYLKDLETQDIVMTRQVTSITSFNVLNSQFNTRVSQKNAKENALRDLARQIERALALYFTGRS